MLSRFYPLLLGVLLALIMWPAPAMSQPEDAIGGAGIGLRQDEDGRVIVERVAPDGPAAKAGLRPGDWLVKVDGHLVARLNGSQLADAIRGRVGTKVVLEYVRDDAEPVAATVTRAALGPPPGKPSTPSERLPQNKPPTSPDPVQSSASQAGRMSGTLRFTSQTIKDPAADNRPAFTFLLPQGWQWQGQIVWMHEFSVLANLRLRLWDTNSGTTIEWLPTQHFSYTDQLPGLLRPGANWMGAIVAAPINDPAQFAEGFWMPHLFPYLRNLRPVSRKDYPELARQAVASNPGWQAQAVRLRYAFEQNGKPWEQDIYFTLAYAPVNSGVAMWNVQRAFTCVAPKGQLDATAALIKTIISNANFTPEWLAAYSVVQQLRIQGLQQQMADTAAFGRKLQEHNAHIQKLSQQMHEDRMKSFDRIAESQREYLGGVETYTDPYQKHGFYMPAGYKEYWVNPKGEVILSEQSGYNPNAGSAEEWRKMERRDPMRQ